MNRLLLALTLITYSLTGLSQGKFFGGDGPSAYTGTTLTVGVPLPVELSNIKAKQVGNHILIEWHTLSELNNDYFVVERAFYDEFESIGNLKGAGTVSLVQQYEFADSSPQSGINYYRLKQVDFDGSTDYSRIVSASYIDGELSVFPNPTKGEFYLSHELFHGKLSLRNTLGQKIIDLNPTQTIDISTFTPGIYILVVALADKQLNFRIVKE